MCHKILCVLGRISTPVVLYLVYEVKRGNDMAKKVYEVEIRGQKEKYYFATKSEAEAYAVTATAWVGGQYRIQGIFINEPVEEVAK